MSQNEKIGCVNGCNLYNCLDIEPALVTILFGIGDEHINTLDFETFFPQTYSIKFYWLSFGITSNDIASTSGELQ